MLYVCATISNIQGGYFTEKVCYIILHSLSKHIVGLKFVPLFNIKSVKSVGNIFINKCTTCPSWFASSSTSWSFAVFMMISFDLALKLIFIVCKSQPTMFIFYPKFLDSFKLLQRNTYSVCSITDMF